MAASTSNSAGSSSAVDAVTVLLQAAKTKTLPKKWNPSNAKLKLKNSIIDRLSELQSHSMALFTLVSSSYMKTKQWKSVCEVITSLATNLQQYTSYLASQKGATKKNLARTEVRSDVDEISVIQ